MFVYWIESFFILARALQTSISGFRANAQRKPIESFLSSARAVAAKRPWDAFLLSVYERNEKVKSPHGISPALSSLVGRKIEWKINKNCALDFQFPNSLATITKPATSHETYLSTTEKLFSSSYQLLSVSMARTSLFW